MTKMTILRHPEEKPMMMVLHKKIHTKAVSYTHLLEDIVGIRRVVIARGYVNLRNGCGVAQI